MVAWVYSQDITVVDRYDEAFGPKPAPIVALRNMINADDYLLGVSAGIVDKTRNLGAVITFDARPYRKSVLELQQGNLFYQYREERYFLGLDLMYHHSLGKESRGVFVQAGSSYTWGVYGGTEQKPDKGWIITPKVGFYLKPVEKLWLKFGYAYQDAKTFDLINHRFFLSITGLITKGYED